MMNQSRQRKSLIRILQDGVPLLIIAVVLTATCACTASRVMKTASETYPPKNPANVRIFLSERPSEQYKEIGRVTVDKYGMVSMVPAPGDKVNALLREEAAKIGGDAVINITEDFASVSGVVVVFIPTGR